MRNLLAYLLLAVWLILAAWFYTCKVKHLCDGWNLFGSKSAATTSLNNNDNDSEDGIIHPAALKEAYGSIFQAEENVSISKSDAEIETGPAFDDSLEGIAAFLNKHTDTKLTITGQYADDEDNDSDYENTGLARANTIKDALVDLGVSDEQIIANSELNNILFADGETVEGKDMIDFKFSEKYEELNETDVKNAYRSIRDLEQLAEFNRNETTVNLLDGSDEAIQHLEYYLNRNKDQQLHILMPYTEDENSGDNEQDIGWIRATDLKNQLQNAGIDEDKIVVESATAPQDIFDENDKSVAGVIIHNFIFPDKSDADKVAEMEMERDLENAINDNEEEEEDYSETAPEDQDIVNRQPNMKYRFDDKEMMVNSTIIRYLDELRRYLKENPDKTVMITGHTDDMGEDIYNDYLGMERAKNGQLLMKKRWIKLDRIDVESDGELNPIADNETASGRRQNRRIEIDIR